MPLTREQTRHEVINLSKTVKLLERSVDNEEWMKYGSDGRQNKWLRAQAILTGVKHCRRVLQNISVNDYDLGLGKQDAGTDFVENTKQVLDRLEHAMTEVDHELKPLPRKRTPILPTLPRPSYPVKAVEAAAPEAASRSNVDQSLIPADDEGEAAPPIPHTGLLESAETKPASLDAMLPSLREASSSSEKARSSTTPAFLETSTALQTDLAEQLAQMARQLKLNSMHFAQTLANDQGVVQDVQEKLERNYDVITKERTRLRDHGGKSRSTTWLLVLSIVVVLVAFMLTYLVIRIT